MTGKSSLGRRFFIELIAEASLEYEELILKHYKKVSTLFGLEESSTMEDRFIRRSEIDFILCEVGRYISTSYRSNPRLLDIGCGNGYLLHRVRKSFPNIELAGIEFTPELFELASSRNISRTTLLNGDIKKYAGDLGMFDLVVTERVIINILNRKHQMAALENIAKSLRPGGRYIMVESFKEPLENLNRARSEMGLDSIDQSYQNLYLRESHVDHLKKQGMEEIKSPIESNFLSTYFYLSRVLHKVIRPDGGRVKDSEFVKFMTGALPPAIGNYSQIIFRVFQKS